MGDRPRALEKRPFCEAGPCSTQTLPPTELLLGKLDQIDVRLKQLEEKQKPPIDSYFGSDLRRQNQCKSLSSALHEAHHKGTLMERLHLLETRIRQLSYELDNSSGVGTSSTEQASDADWPRPVTLEKPITSQIFRRGARQLDNYKKEKVKDSKEALESVEKSSAMCRSEKRMLERTWIYRRWFPVGC